jgi:hypothetical protein
LTVKHYGLHFLSLFEWLAEDREYDNQGHAHPVNAEWVKFWTDDRIGV